MEPPLHADHRLGPEIAEEQKKIQPLLAPRPRRRAKTAVKVAGLENVLVRFSKCCSPIPGEKIIGFITKGRGVALHRYDCQNIIRQEIPREKMVKATWNPEVDAYFPIEIEIEAFDRVGVLKDILAEISESGTNVSSVKEAAVRGSTAFIRLTVDVKDVKHLDRVMLAVRKVADVYDVRR